MSNFTAAEEKKFIQLSLYMAEKNCSNPWIYNYARTLPGLTINLHQLMMCMGGAMTIVASSIALFLLYQHLTCMTRPREQAYYIRIILWIPVMTLTAFFSIWFYDADDFLTPVSLYYEGFSIISIYMLFCATLVSGNIDLRHNSFASVKQALWALDDRYASGERSIAWVRRSWFLVYQLVITRAICLIALEVISSENCPLSEVREYGSLALQTVQSFCTGLAVFGVLAFYRRTSHLLRRQRPGLKLLAFKLAVALQGLQSIIFPILSSEKVFFPTAPFYISYNDFLHGLPQLMFIFEVFICSFIFLPAFNAQQYQDEHRNGAPIVKGPFMAFLAAANPLDLFRGFASGFRKTDPSQFTIVKKESEGEISDQTMA